MRTKTFYSVLMGLAVFGMLIGTSCKSSKESAKAPKGEEIFELPCSGPDFFTNKDFFRASAVGESSDQMLSKKKAQAAAREELAASLSVTIKTVVDNYYSSKTVDNVEEAKTRFEGLSRQVVNQKLTGVKTICEKFAKTKEGNFKCYTALELSGEELIKGIQSRIAQDDKLRLDFEYEKFKGELEKEMDKMGN